MSTLSVPFFLALVGIILRGLAYALRAGARTRRERGLIDDVFALSSILTPFALGAAVGGIATGRVPVELVGGFRARALLSGVAAGVLALAALAVVRVDAPRLFDGLTHGAGLAAVIVSGVAGVVTLLLVWAGRFEPARYLGALAVAALVAGWAAAQRPDFLPGLTVSQAAAGRTTLITVLVVVGIGALVLVPSLALLFGLVLRGRFDLPRSPEADVAPRQRGQPSPMLGAALLGVLVAGALLAVFATSWGLAVGIALLLVFVLGGFVVLASGTALAEAADPAGDRGAAQAQAWQVTRPGPAGDAGVAATGSRGTRSGGYARLALAAVYAVLLRRLVRAVRARRGHPR